MTIWWMLTSFFSISAPALLLLLFRDHRAPQPDRPRHLTRVVLPNTKTRWLLLLTLSTYVERQRHGEGDSYLRRLVSILIFLVTYDCT